MDVLKYLPIGSFVNYYKKGFDKDVEKLFGIPIALSKMTMHFAYAVVPIIALGGWIDSGVRTGEWNFKTQIRANIEKNDKIEAEIKRKRELREKIFGENGFADVDKDGRLSLVELADAYTRMRVDKDVLRTKSLNIQPSVKQLERAVESYESDSK